jgi:CRISPR-associated protein Cmr5
MSVNDLEKKRSQFAYGCVVEAIENFKKDTKKQKEYKSYIKKIPMMILNNGLGATFAFIYSKKKDGNAYELIYKQVDEWLKKDSKDDLVKWIIDQESQQYRATTNEVLALFNWLKRFADGMIEGESNGE